MVIKINLNPMQELEDETKVISYDVNVVVNGTDKICEQLEQKLNEQLNKQPINSKDAYVIDCIRQVLHDEGVVRENKFAYGNILWTAGNVIKTLDIII